MSISNPLEYARSLNNKACCLMKQQHYDEAVSSLMVALKETKRIALEAKSNAFAPGSSHQVGGPSCFDTRSAPAGTPCSEDYQCEFESLCRNDKARQQQCFETSLRLPYVYENPIFIDECSLAWDEPIISRFSFFIMFNLALVHHLKGLLAGGDEEETAKNLKVSKRLYELTFQMQAQESESNLVLMAALLNNLSLVHTALHANSEAQQCQQLLLSALLLLVDMGAQVAEARYQSSYIDGFMGNVVHLMVTESPVALAA